MKYLLFFLIFIHNPLHACGLCATDIPQVFVDVEISYEKEKTNFDIQWKFQEEFVNSLTQYDLNENNIFDENEKLMIENSLVTYLKDLHYLTNISYKNINQYTKDTFIESITPTFSQLTIENQNMIYHYKFDLPFSLENRHKLYIGFSDEGGNFSFFLQDLILKNYTNTYTLNKSVIDATIVLNSPILIKNKKNISVQNMEQNIIKVDNTPSFLELLEIEFNKLKENLKLLLQDIKDNNNIFSFFWLLIFSFLYGILHAIGPGHGKSLVGSYFISQNKSYIKAANISILIGVVHTFSAFLLTLVVYNSINFIFNSTITNIEQISTKISASIIIMIALYLIYKKIKTVKTNFTFTTSSAKVSFLSPQVTHQKSLSCGCNSCKTTSTDLGVILAAGIIPCPGTVTIFLFTMSLGIYFVGFMSAVFMSIGMSLIIFITAIISVKIRKSTQKHTAIQTILEYTSLLFILLLGLFLLIL